MLKAVCPFVIIIGRTLFITFINRFAKIIRIYCRISAENENETYRDEKNVSLFFYRSKKPRFVLIVRLIVFRARKNQQQNLNSFFYERLNIKKRWTKKSNLISRLKLRSSLTWSSLLPQNVAYYSYFSLRCETARTRQASQIDICSFVEFYRSTFNLLV